MALEQALDRPVTYHNRERHLVMICCIEQLVYPILLIVVLIVNLIRYLYLSDLVGIGTWYDMFLLQPIAVTLPLLPISFPTWWIFLNCFGMARFKALFKLYQSSKKTQVCRQNQKGICSTTTFWVTNLQIDLVCRSVRGCRYFWTDSSRCSL